MMLVMVMGVWVSGRAMLWENPFPLELPSVETFFAEGDRNKRSAMSNPVLADARSAGTGHVLANAFPQSLLAVSAIESDAKVAGGAPLPIEARGNQAMPPIIAAGHQFLMAAAFAVDWNAASTVHARATDAPSRLLRPSPDARSVSLIGGDLDRWSLDAFAFYRAGSGSSAISQGRAPVYGASQAGANLQYRIAPQSQHDPRAYIRAYRAFVAQPETEAAIGVSAKPAGSVPLRVAAEIRVTDGAFGADIRPATYAVTELAPQTLPLSGRLEVYAGAGYVGGDAATPFVDGQVAVTGEVTQYSGLTDDPVRLSLGAGAWGGAQDDASRLDVGPTLRLDVSVGDIPARLSVDWRERVAGDAEPGSGIAATLSTRF